MNEKKSELTVQFKKDGNNSFEVDYTLGNVSISGKDKYLDSGIIHTSSKSLPVLL